MCVRERGLEGSGVEISLQSGSGEAHVFLLSHLAGERGLALLLDSAFPNPHRCVCLQSNANSRGSQGLRAGSCRSAHPSLTPAPRPRSPQDLSSLSLHCFLPLSDSSEFSLLSTDTGHPRAPLHVLSAPCLLLPPRAGPPLDRVFTSWPASPADPSGVCRKTRISSLCH